MKLLNIATLIAVLLTVADHSSSRAVATTIKSSEYENETKYETLEQEDEDDAVVAIPLPILLRGANKAVYQFLSDGDGDGDSSSCGTSFDECNDNSDCCSGFHCCDAPNGICQFVPVSC